jgi:hypothetical protein
MFHLEGVTLNQRCLEETQFASSGASFLFKSTAHSSTVTWQRTTRFARCRCLFSTKLDNFDTGGKWARSNVGKRLHQTTTAAEIRNASLDFPALREKSATRALKRAELSEPAHCYISEALSHH